MGNLLRMAVLFSVSMSTFLVAGCAPKQPFVTRDEMRNAFASTGGWGTKNNFIFEDEFQKFNMDFASGTPSWATANRTEGIKNHGIGPSGVMLYDPVERLFMAGGNKDVEIAKMSIDEKGNPLIEGFSSRSSPVVTSYDNQVESVMSTIRQLGLNNREAIEKWLQSQVDKKQITADVAKSVLDQIGKVVDNTGKVATEALK